MKVLITGDTGFIGTNLKQHVGDLGHEVIGFSTRNGFDIMDRGQVESAVSGMDVVIHGAAFADPAASIDQPEKTIDINLLGTLNVLKACAINDVPCTNISSCEIYGDGEGPITEEAPFKPPNPYAMSKAAADLLTHTFHRAYEADVRSVRLFNPYGPLQQLNKIVPRFFFQARKNAPITVYGDDSDTRDYVFVGDVVRGIWASSDAPAGTSVNLATGVATTSREMAELIRSLTGSTSSIEIVPYPANFGGIFRQVRSSESAEKMIGWKPEVPLEEGVLRTMSWLDHLDE